MKKPLSFGRSRRRRLQTVSEQKTEIVAKETN
jgi:hypothetical protein